MKSIVCICSFILALCCCAYSPAQINTDRELLPHTWPYNIPLKDSQEIESAIGLHFAGRMMGVDSAVQLMHLIENQCKQINYVYGRIRVLGMLSQVYLRSAGYSKSITALLTAEKLCNQNPDMYKLLPSIYQCMGTVSEHLGYTQQATRYYLKALDALQKHPGTFTDVMNVYNSLASVVPDKKVAMHYLDESYRLAEQKGKTRLMGIALQNKSILYERLDDTVNASRVIEESYQLALEHTDTFLRYMAHVRWTYNYLHRAKPVIAAEHLRKAAAFKGKLRLNLFEQNAYQMLSGDVAYHLKDYKGAAGLLLQALETARQYGLKEQEVRIYNSLSQIYQDAGMPQEAITFQNQYVDYLNRISNEKIAQGVSLMEIQFRTNEKDKQLQIQKMETAKRNNLLWAVSLCTLLLIILFVVYYRSVRSKQGLLQKEQEIATMKALVAGEEIERKRISEELHDGVMVRFSCVKMSLASAIDDIPEQYRGRVRQAMYQLDDATAELRQSAHNLMPELLLKEGLEGALKYFCEYLHRYIGVVYLQNAVLPAISAPQQLTLFRVVQELAQNVLKHAMAQQIIIQMDYLEDRLYITVEDNGIGFDPVEAAARGGMGLRNIEARILSLGGTLTVDSEVSAGTSITIEMDRASLEN